MLVGSEYVILVLGWSLWCFLHSLLISNAATEFFKKRTGNSFKFYRLVFNLFAILSVIPLVVYTVSLEGAPVFVWDGWLRIPQLLMIAVALVYFIAGGRVYDSQQLLGIRQIRTNEAHSTLDEFGEISTKGILGFVRHPWYAGTLLLIWARELDTVGVTLNLVLSTYLIVGTLLEERRLRGEFGESYREYQRQVSMFFPWNDLWRKLRLKFLPGRDAS
jgi:protein-S-isoprenylcysteine O-methyltransferase Ste14